MDGDDHRARSENRADRSDDSAGGIGAAAIFGGLGAAVFAAIKASKPILLFLQFIGAGLKWFLLLMKGGVLAIKAGLISLWILGTAIGDGGYFERAIIYAGHFGRAKPYEKFAEMIELMSRGPLGKQRNFLRR
jgi:hypothetical protein